MPKVLSVSGLLIRSANEAASIEKAVAKLRQRAGKAGLRLDATLAIKNAPRKPAAKAVAAKPAKMRTKQVKPAQNGRALGQKRRRERERREKAQKKG